MVYRIQQSDNTPFFLLEDYKSGGTEAKEMLERVIPIYHTQDEHDEFKEYIRSKGFGRYKMFGEKMEGEALERLQKTTIAQYEDYNIPVAAEIIAILYLSFNKRVLS